MHLAGAVQVWNVSQPTPLRTIKLGAQQAPALGVALLPGGGSRALVALADGGVAAVDVARREVLWRRPAGHTETIFAAAFAPHDPDVLATASFGAMLGANACFLRPVHCSGRTRFRAAGLPHFGLPHH
jgi:hypothetical protein